MTGRTSIMAQIVNRGNTARADFTAEAQRTLRQRRDRSDSATEGRREREKERKREREKKTLALSLRRSIALSLLRSVAPSLRRPFLCATSANLCASAVNISLLV